MQISPNDCELHLYLDKSVFIPVVFGKKLYVTAERDFEKIAFVLNFVFNALGTTACNSL